jgi:hypothetical protein
VKRLGDARLEALALAIVDRIASHPQLSLAARGRAMQAVSDRLRAAFQVDSELDGAARQRIRSLKRDVPEGSREWDLLYRQYITELARRR